MARTSAVRVLEMLPGNRATRGTTLHEALVQAAGDAKRFAESSEVKDSAQKQRYLALHDALRAQANSLRAEVADALAR
jgi:CRISPR/Cas system-associated exonuclease Cas4 (RecB family)